MNIQQYSTILNYSCFQHFESIMEGVQENEPNTVELKVDSTMTREEVVAKIFENIEKLSC